MVLEVDTEASPGDAERNWPSSSPELKTLYQEVKAGKSLREHCLVRLNNAGAADSQG